MKNIPKATQAAVDVIELLDEFRDFALLLINSIQFPTVPIIPCFPQSYKDSAHKQENVIFLYPICIILEREAQRHWTLN